jgi:two-component system response regulator TrcR
MVITRRLPLYFVCRSCGNDYLRKPFSLEELILRIRELIRRHEIKELGKGPLRIGRFKFQAHRQELEDIDGSVIRLSHRESELLHMLASHQNRLLERKVALTKLWGDDNSFHARTMDVFITRLRKQLQGDPNVEIINVRGLGYKLLVNS